MIVGLLEAVSGSQDIRILVCHVMYIVAFGDILGTEYAAYAAENVVPLKEGSGKAHWLLLFNYDINYSFLYINIEYIVLSSQKSRLGYLPLYFHRWLRNSESPQHMH